LVLPLRGLTVALVVVVLVIVIIIIIVVIVIIIVIVIVIVVVVREKAARTSVQAHSGAHAQLAARAVHFGRRGRRHDAQQQRHQQRREGRPRRIVER